MPALEFVAQSNRDGDNRAATTERLVNFYPEPLPAGSRAQFSLRSVLGTEAWAETNGFFIRSVEMIPDLASGNADRLFAAVGGKLKSVSELGNVSDIGTIPDAVETTISGNNGVVTVVSGGEYHTWNGTTLGTPTAGAFTDVGSVEFLRGYTLLTELNGRKIQWSALADADSLPGLNFATAEARDDVNIRGVAISGNYWVFKTSSIEIWQVTGSASENAFTAIPGLVIERGLKDFNLITKFPGGAFFIGDDNIPYLAGGTQVQALSHAGVQTAIEAKSPTHCTYYEDNGHKFLAIRFEDAPAWVFDFSMGKWHERALGEFAAWDVIHTAFAWGKWRAADIFGRIKTLTRNNQDIDDPLIRIATSQTVYNDGSRIRIPRLEILGRVGRSDIGRQAVLGMRVSRDGGNTFGPIRERDMGDLGEYYKRMVFRNLGQARGFAVELRISDPVDLTMWSSANMDIA